MLITIECTLTGKQQDLEVDSDFRSSLLDFILEETRDKYSVAIKHYESFGEDFCDIDNLQEYLELYITEDELPPRLWKVLNSSIDFSECSDYDIETIGEFLDRSSLDYIDEALELFYENYSFHPPNGLSNFEDYYIGHHHSEAKFVQAYLIENSFVSVIEDLNDIAGIEWFDYERVGNDIGCYYNFYEHQSVAGVFVFTA